MGSTQSTWGQACRVKFPEADFILIYQREIREE